MNLTISNFWTAVVASIVLTATAILLDGNEHAGKVLIGEISAFGIRLGDQVLKLYNSGQTERMEKQIELERTRNIN